MRVDLSSLGKGRGVDRVAEYLDARGVTNYLIDLSGKLRARGRNARGEPWRVAVERPAADVSSAVPAIEPAIVALQRRKRGHRRRLSPLLRERRPALFAHHRSANRISRDAQHGVGDGDRRRTACRPTRSRRC